MLTKNLDQH